MPGAYNSIDVSQPHVLRGTLQQTDTGLLYKPPTYKNAGTSFSFGGIRVGGISLHNRSAATCAVGYGVRIPNYLWKAGQWVDSTTTFTDDTTDAQNTTTNDFPLETTTANDGYVILSRIPFNAVSINVSTASVDAGTVARAVRFSDSTGAAWQSADTNLFVQDGLVLNYATGENCVVFSPPVDWGLSTTALGTGIPENYYAMNVRSTDPPATTAGLAKAIEIFRLFMPTEGLADNGLYEWGWAGAEITMPTEGDALVALFGTANDMNRVSANVRSAG